MIEAKYQCIVCEKVEICKLCFTGKYHDHHEFIMRAAPDKEWEAALRGNNASHYNDDYQRIMRELQTREIRPEDYELLLSLEQRGNTVPIAKFMAVSYEKMLPLEKKTFLETVGSVQTCSFCNLRIDHIENGLQLRGCDHCVHKGCLEDMFRLKKNQCGVCEKVVAEGFEKSMQIVPVRAHAKKANKKKKEEELKEKIIAEM